MIERIVVPLDGSLTAEGILPQLRRILYRSDSEIILVRAAEPPMVENALVPGWPIFPKKCPTPLPLIASPAT